MLEGHGMLGDSDGKLNNEVILGEDVSVSTKHMNLYLDCRYKAFLWARGHGNNPQGTHRKMGCEHSYT